MPDKNSEDWEIFIVTNHTTPQKHLRAAGWIWVTSGVLYFLFEAIAAVAFEPTYSYAQNYISDLGVPICGTVFDGRAICSPLHGLMNFNFLLHGTLFFTGAWLVLKTLKSRAKYPFIAFAGIHIAGNILLASFPGASADATTGLLHVTGAVCAILGGNLATLISPLTYEFNAPTLLRTASKALPVLGFVGFVFLAIAQLSSLPVFLPEGIWERISVDTIMLWEITIGIWLLKMRSTN